ncbi:hypothetical protein GQ457_02G023240 [Hibiscus cannabinus]
MEGANKEEGRLEEVEKMKGSSSESDAAKDNVNQPSINEGGSKDQGRDESLTGNQLVSDKQQEASDNETKPSPMKPVKNGSSDLSGDKIQGKDKPKPGDQKANLVLHQRPDPNHPIEDNCCDKYCPKCCAKCCIL